MVRPKLEFRGARVCRMATRPTWQQNLKLLLSTVIFSVGILKVKIRKTAARKYIFLDAALPSGRRSKQSYGNASWSMPSRHNKFYSTNFPLFRSRFS